MQRETSAPGQLRNGNPRGNPNLAPRCGARTRAGCACQAPAMTNGRCRMHGGRSTGVASQAGRERIRAAHTTHGGYGAEGQEALHRHDGAMRALRRALRLLDQGDETAALELLVGEG